MAGTAELRRLLGMERLEERLPVRRGIEMQQEIVSLQHHRMSAGGQIVEGRVRDGEITLPHRAADVHDRMARRAPEAGLCFRSVDLILDRPVEPAVEEHCMVVASRAPLGRRDAGHILHVFDRLAIPLIVER